MSIYGLISPAEGGGGRPVTVLAGEVINPNGGCFVTNNGSGKYVVCTSSSQTIAGYIIPEKGLETIPAGDATRNMIEDGIFEVPYLSSNNAYTAADIGKVVDLNVTSTVQTVDKATSTHDLLRIVGGDAARGTVYVQINDNERYRG